MNKELLKQECIVRMNMLELHENVIKEFEQEEKLNKSENIGTLFWLNEKEQEIVKWFEEKYNSIVYHVIYNHTELGEMYSLLYVGDNQDEWKMERQDIQDNIPMVYVYVVGNTYDSEFGAIGIRKNIGGLIRTA